VIVALIEQGAIDLGGRLVSETRRVQQIEHYPALRNAQGPGWPRARAGYRCRRGQPGAPALHTGAGAPERGAGRGGQSADRSEGHDRFGRGHAVGGRQRDAQQRRNFFWMSMTASARARRCVRRALFSCKVATTAESGLGSVV